MKTHDDILYLFQMILEMEYTCRQNLVREFLQIASLNQGSMEVSRVSEEKIRVLHDFYQQIHVFLKENQGKILEARGEDVSKYYDVCMHLIVLLEELHSFQFQIFELETLFVTAKHVTPTEELLLRMTGLSIDEALGFDQEQTKIKIKVQEKTVRTMIQEINDMKGE